MTEREHPYVRAIREQEESYRLFKLGQRTGDMAPYFAHKEELAKRSEEARNAEILDRWREDNA